LKYRTSAWSSSSSPISISLFIAAFIKKHLIFPHPSFLYLQSLFLLPMGFEVIPAIDIKGGRCVQLRQGKSDAVLFSAENPVMIALHWVSMGASRLHIIDLDAALQVGTDNFGIIAEIVKQAKVKGRAKVQVGGGVRSYKAALRLLNLGVD